jgi:hypothetical protein
LSVRFYYGSGSPYAWRVWFALEHKGIPYHRKTLSFDASDLKTGERSARVAARRSWSTMISRSPNPRRSSNISRSAGHRGRPFSPAIREADDDLADLGQPLASGEGSQGARNDPRQELALWEDAATGGYLTCELSASRSIRSWPSSCESPAA